MRSIDLVRKNAHKLSIVLKSILSGAAMPRIRHKTLECSPGCTVEATLGVIGGKWKGVVLYHLFEEEVLRFNEIRRRLPNVTQRMLTSQLRELEKDGLISRKIYPEIPPKVEYRLSDRGRTLEPVIRALKAWGDNHVDLAAARAESRSAGPAIDGEIQRAR
jgi:DNA-binding HxlR family transcriptional regulator